MEIIRLAFHLPLLTLAACQGKSLLGTNAQNDEQTEWTLVSLV